MNSSSDEEWETTSDVSTDQEHILENFMEGVNHSLLDEIARRSIAALGSNAPDNLGGFNEESVDQNDIPAEDEFVAPPEEIGSATSSNTGNDENYSVKFRPNPSDNAESERSSE